MTMKRIKNLLLLLLAAALLTGSALAIELDPGTGDDIYVVDDANVLSASTVQTIVDYNAFLEQNCRGAQLVVVTVNYLDEYTDVAAAQLMDDWGVGDAGESNGMLLLYVVQQAKGWLSVGEGIDHDFTDDDANAYLDEYFWEYVDAYEPDEAVLSIAEPLVGWYADYYGADLDSYEATGDTGSYDNSHDSFYTGSYAEPYQEPDHHDSGGAPLLTLICVVIILWLIVSLSRMARMRSWGYTGGFWPVFWFGGPRLWRDWRHRAPRPPHGPGPRPPHGGGPGGFGGGPRPPRGGGSRPGTGGNPGGFGGGPRPGGGSRPGGNSFGGSRPSGGGRGGSSGASRPSGGGRGGSFGGSRPSGGFGGGRSGGGGGGRR